MLLITPPFTQLNTPYPASSSLKGFLNTIGVSSFQIDLGLEVFLKLFCKETLKELFSLANRQGSIKSKNAQGIYELKDAYLNPLADVISFLQGNQQTLARLICTESFLPQASRFHQLEDVDWAFGSMGLQDKAKHLATLYLEDISDFIIECIDANFGFSRYAERLGISANSFDEIYEQLQLTPSYIDELTVQILEKHIREFNPKCICFSVPFPGNLFSALRCAKYIKALYPDIKTAMGGGFPNTELRSLTDTRVFEFFDFISLDDGALPLELIHKAVFSADDEINPNTEFKRTYHLHQGTVYFNNNSNKKDYKLFDCGTPDYTDLLLNKYVSVIEIANPMHSLWSDGRWNKLTMAHGCYWAQCTFCDTSLDYIKSYEALDAVFIVNQIEAIIKQTGERGFHFVDEAAPPALMKALAIEILRRNLTITWWTNIRFEKSFTADLCKLLQASGCIAVSGGIEVASDRLLKLIKKGVTVEQVAQVCNNFTESGIMVHAYLMYGFPTQTIQETIDSLEMVRQMFELGILQSGFWHQFALTAHSPIGLNSKDYNIKPNLEEISYANNDIQFKDTTGIDHSKFSFGLKKSIYNFMQGVGFDLPLNEWFNFKIPRTRIKNRYIYSCLTTRQAFNIKETAELIWLGNIKEQPTDSNAQSKDDTNRTFLIRSKTQEAEISMNANQGKWLLEALMKASINNKQSLHFGQMQLDYEQQFGNFDLLWYSKTISTLKENGLLLI